MNRLWLFKAALMQRLSALGRGLTLGAPIFDMAVLTGPGVIASGGGAGQPRWAVLSFQKVTTGDTFDMSTLTSIAPFTTVTAALFVATSNRTATTTLGTIAGTVVTLLGVGIAADSGYLFVIGE